MSALTDLYDAFLAGPRSSAAYDETKAALMELTGLGSDETLRRMKGVVAARKLDPEIDVIAALAALPAPFHLYEKWMTSRSQTMPVGLSSYESFMTTVNPIVAEIIAASGLTARQVRDRLRAIADGFGPSVGTRTTEDRIAEILAEVAEEEAP